jgi:hypothetical protein
MPISDLESKKNAVQTTENMIENTVEQPPQYLAYDDPFETLLKGLNKILPTSTTTENQSNPATDRETTSQKKIQMLQPVSDVPTTKEGLPKLSPAAMSAAMPPIKKITTPPKLVIGRITVEIMPPSAPIVKTIVQTQAVNNNTASSDTLSRLSFGLGQL